VAIAARWCLRWVEILTVYPQTNRSMKVTWILLMSDDFTLYKLSASLLFKFFSFQRKVTVFWSVLGGIRCHSGKGDTMYICPVQILEKMKLAVFFI